MLYLIPLVAGKATRLQRRFEATSQFQVTSRKEVRFEAV
jgi:hypothetical protein